MAAETTPAVRLRSEVVSRVILAIIFLTFLLYTACIVLIILGRGVPGELWLGAGNASGALFALLINSKNDGPPAPIPGTPDGEPLKVEGVEGGEPVAVAADTFPEEPEYVEEVLEVENPEGTATLKAPRARKR